MEQLAVISNVLLIVENIITTLHRIKTACSSIGAYLPSEADLRPAKLHVDGSLKEIQSWKSTWSPYLEEDQNSNSAEAIWGSHGFHRIHDLLQDIDKEGEAIKITLESLQAVLKLKKNASPFQIAVRKLSKLGLVFSQRRKNAKGIGTIECIIRVEEYARQIILLCTMSEVSFRKAHQDYAPSIATLRPAFYWSSTENMLQSQKETGAFYNFCASTSSEMYLELDVLGSSGLLRWTSGGESQLYSNKCYAVHHRLSTSIERFWLWHAKPAVENSAEIYKDFGVISRSRYLETLEAGISSGNHISIALPAYGSKCNVPFSVAGEPRSIAADESPMAFATLSDSHLEHYSVKGGWASSISQSEKHKLAYKIAEFSIFFLGTPFMNHLTQNHLKQCSVDGKSRYVVQVSGNECDSIRDDPATVSIRNQIFNVGDLLMDLALEDYSHSNDPQVASEELLKVQRAMGHKYRAACEFCLHRNRRFTPARVGTGSETGEEVTTIRTNKTDPNDKNLEDAKVIGNGHNVDSVTTGEEVFRRGSGDTQASWYFVEAEESIEECMIELQQFYSEVFERLNEAYGATIELEDTC